MVRFRVSECIIYLNYCEKWITNNNLRVYYILNSKSWLTLWNITSLVLCLIILKINWNKQLAGTVIDINKATNGNDAELWTLDSLS